MSHGTYERLQADLNYYTLIGVSSNATSQEVTNAYRTLAKKWHPDRNEASHAAETFKLLTKIYDVLRDSTQRQVYNLSRNQAESREPIDLEFTLPVTLAQIYMGTTVLIKIDRIRPCIDCSGSASIGCIKCAGYGYSLLTESLEVTVKKGVVDGTKLHLSGEGNQYRVQQSAGQLTLVAREIADSVFIRKGHDLHMDVTISSCDLIRGFDLSFVHLDGKRYRVQVSPAHVTAKSLLVEQLGFQTGSEGQTGNLYIHLQHTPKNHFEMDKLTSETLSLDLGTAQTPPYSSNPPTFSTASSSTQLLASTRTPRSRLKFASSCHISGSTKPIGVRKELNSDFGSTYKWSCCGSHSRNPTHHY